MDTTAHSHEPPLPQQGVWTPNPVVFALEKNDRLTGSGHLGPALRQARGCSQNLPLNPSAITYVIRVDRPPASPPLIYSCCCEAHFTHWDRRAALSAMGPRSAWLRAVPSAPPQAASRYQHVSTSPLLTGPFPCLHPGPQRLWTHTPTGIQTHTGSPLLCPHKPACASSHSARYSFRHPYTQAHPHTLKQAYICSLLSPNSTPPTCQIQGSGLAGKSQKAGFGVST